jgi:hypothetical protein
MNTLARNNVVQHAQKKLCRLQSAPHEIGRLMREDLVGKFSIGKVLDVEFQNELEC